MKVKIVNQSNNPLPAYETVNSAGMDLRAYLPEGPVTLEPMQRGLIPTGLYMEIPEGYEGQVRPRSGLAIKSGISVLNSPGTVDKYVSYSSIFRTRHLSSTAATVSHRWSSPNVNRPKLCRWKLCRKPNVGLAALVTLEKTNI